MLILQRYHGQTVYIGPTMALKTFFKTKDKIEIVLSWKNDIREEAFVLKEGESKLISQATVLTIFSIGSVCITIGLEAPRSIQILRHEVLWKKREKD